MSDLSHKYADMVHSPFLSGEGAKNVLVAELDIATENLADEARWDFFKLPSDAIVTDAYLYTTELDSATTLTLNIETEDEDGGGTTELLSADTVGQSGGWVAADSNLPILTDSKDYFVFVTVEAAPGTAVAGTAKLVIEYFRARV